MIATIATLLGGIGLFLLGMGMMTDGLKVTAGPALRTLLERWTSSTLRGLFAGMLITALVQSSSAVTVATVGFVNAGLLTLSQAIWVVFGANVGTTMTAWLVALVGVKLDVGALALPLLGFGMLLGLAGRARARLAGLGRAIAGFGAFFLGVAVLQQGFDGISDQFPDLTGAGRTLLSLLGLMLVGFLLTALTQSSSTAIAIALTAANSGAISLLPAAAIVIGTNVGTTSTAAFAAIGATPAAQRVAVAHILFNLITGAAALILLGPLLQASLWLADSVTGNQLPATVLALFHTQFNLMGVLLMWPLAPWLTGRLAAMFQSDRDRLGKPRFLDASLAQVPALAIRGLLLEISGMAAMLFGPARARVAGNGSAPSPDTSAAHEAALELGQQIRAFISRVTTHPLPPEDVAALSDLIRATQHLEELAATADQIDPAARTSGIAPTGWAELVGAASECLQLRMVDDQTLPELARLTARTELAYQAVKTDLLAATASGHLTPARLEPALAEARAIRRAAETAAKAQRRLLPWVSRAGTPTSTDADGKD